MRALNLVGLALLAGALLGGTRWLTAERIDRASSAFAERQIAAVLGPDGSGAENLCRTDKRGYAGRIELAIGYRADGAIRAVRVIAHRETPGIGDFIDEQRSSWIHAFADRRPSGDPRADYESWAATIDSVTGATVTRRAVLQAVAAGCAI